MIGKKIKKIREQAGLTQTKLAFILGVLPSTVSKYESGAIIPPATKYEKILSLSNNKAGK